MPEINSPAPSIQRQTDYYNRPVKFSALPDDLQEKIKFIEERAPRVQIPLLEQVTIGESETFYSLDSDDRLDSETLGVTTKIYLIHAKSAEDKINALYKSLLPVSSSSETKECNVKFNTEAIIKYPKNNNVLEILREQIALEISKILSLQTTDSKMIELEGKPALLVYFKDIRLLSDLCHGKQKQAYSSQKTYTDDATFKPVGEGFEPESFIQEIGLSFAYFFLCNDPDTIGGYLRNLAILNNRLFIFDQAIKPDSEYISLDPGFNFTKKKLLTIEGFLARASRHCSFRNKHLLSCSALSEKLKSIQILSEKQQAILSHIDNIIDDYQQQNNQSNNKTLDALIPDAINIKKKIIKRGNELAKILPEVNGHAGTYANALLTLAKLLQLPVSYHPDGRPFKLPWAKRQLNAIQQIDVSDQQIILTFNVGLTEQQQHQLAWLNSKTQLGIQFNPQVKNQLSLIPDDKLTQLTEEKLYPECSETVQLNNEYLAAEDLKQLASHYPVKQEITDRYIKMVAQAINQDNPHEKAAAFQELLKDLQKDLNQTKASGFLPHLLKRCCYESIRFACLYASPELSQTLQKNFTVAKKLDRLCSFSYTLLSAISKNQLTQKEMQPISDFCEQKCQNLNNYQQAVNLSIEFKKLLENCLAKFNFLSMTASSSTSTQSLFDFSNQFNSINEAAQAASSEATTVISEYEPKPAPAYN